MKEPPADAKTPLEEILSEQARDALREAPLPQEAELLQPVPMERDDPGPGWVFEPLFDGVRCLAIRDGDSLQLLANGTRPLSTRIPDVEQALLEAGPEAFALDGEILDVDPQFEQGIVLAGADRAAEPPDDGEEREREPRFIAFDLLHLDGYDLTGLSLDERRRVLRARFHFSPTLMYARESVAPARLVFDQAEREGWRGVVAKRRDGAYDPAAEEWRVWRLRGERRAEPEEETQAEPDEESD